MITACMRTNLYINNVLSNVIISNASYSSVLHHAAPATELSSQESEPLPRGRK